MFPSIRRYEKILYRSRFIPNQLPTNITESKLSQEISQPILLQTVIFASKLYGDSVHM